VKPVRLAAAALALVCSVSFPGARPAAAADDPPCPIAKASPPVSAPPRPTPPESDNTEDPVGGERMGSTGLVLPDGVAARLPKGLNAHSWVLADLDSGEVLAACSPHALHQPASTLKLLTALTALPRVKPEQVVTVTSADLAFESGSSAVGLVEGGRYKVETPRTCWRAWPGVRTASRAGWPR
jgi:D-alanyl-D-alanine carboxypeptidase (penicillin-binding protein 5/6)